MSTPKECRVAISQIMNNLTDIVNFMNQNPHLFIRIDNVEAKLLEAKHLLNQQIVNLQEDFLSKAIN